MHGSGDNQPNVQKSKIQSYSVEHCMCEVNEIPEVFGSVGWQFRSGIYDAMLLVSGVHEAFSYMDWKLQYL